MSVIKDKRKICKQLLSALTQTVTILTDNLPNALIHGITKNTHVPPLPNATCSHFPASGMQANNYMFEPNAWLLTPAVRNKPKLPTPKVGKGSSYSSDGNPTRRRMVATRL
jgi:hypothetical protein